MVSKVIKALSKLSKTQRTDNSLFLNGSDLLWAAWEEPKPLFKNNAERTESAELLERSLPLLELTFDCIRVQIIPDKVEEALSFRSGLQFLFDELHDHESGVYERAFEPFLECESLKECDEVVASNKSYHHLYNYHTPKTEEEKKNIPKHHHWWFDNTKT